MSTTTLRVGGGLLAAASMGLVGVLGLDRFGADQALGTWAFLGSVAVGAGIGAYAAIEWLQTRRLDSLTRQFDTRTLVLMPVAMAMNIVLGTAVASALKAPIYLDSIGTILVGALAGPLAGGVTGLLANLVWTYLLPPPLGSPYAAPFAIVAFVIGLLAGTFGRWGWLRPRPGTTGLPLLVGAAAAMALVVLMAALALLGWQAVGGETSVLPSTDDTAFLVLGWVAVALVVATGIGLALLLVWKRDLAAVYVVLAGVITGLVAAFIAAPIAANVFGGVTGSGTDLVVAALRHAGADLQQAILGQSLISDPIDKVITYFAVYLILTGLPLRTKARFPQGDRLLPVAPLLREAG